MIGEFPIIPENKSHIYYNIITVNNTSYDISFNNYDTTDNIYINATSMIFIDSSTKNLESPLSYDINFIDILHYYSLTQKNITNLDIKNDIIKMFFFSSGSFNLLSNVLNNKNLLLDIFSFFKNINIQEINNFEEQDLLLDLYKNILDYFSLIFERDDIILLYSNFNTKSSIINIPVSFRIKLCIMNKLILFDEYKLELYKTLINRIEQTTTDFIKVLDDK